MKFKDLIKAEFSARPNRFIGEVIINGQVEIAHIPNTGRLKELLYPGNTVYLTYQDNPKRKTKYELILAEKEGQIVSVDSQLPNKLLYEAIVDGQLDFGIDFDEVKREVKFQQSRFDVFLNGNQPTFIEVKGVTLVNDGYAMFPDAPTTRGLKHVNEMIIAKEKGYHGIILFLVQLSPVKGFKPHTIRQPEFTQALINAKKAGIDLIALQCNVSIEGIDIVSEIPVILEG